MANGEEDLCDFVNVLSGQLCKVSIGSPIYFHSPEDPVKYAGFTKYSVWIGLFYEEIMSLFLGNMLFTEYSIYSSHVSISFPFLPSEYNIKLKLIFFSSAVPPSSGAFQMPTRPSSASASTLIYLFFSHGTFFQIS